MNDRGRDSDELIFAEEDAPKQEATEESRPWPVLVVDDDEFVHQVTSLVLKEYHFQGRSLELISAHSGEEAKRILTSRNDIALILLDVVMEENDSGLGVARWIRGELNNHFVRIILRTGQPGHAPETEVISRYDINDYKEKSELTTQKLFTAVTTALRSYADITAIERNRRGLEVVIRASADLFRQRSLSRFASGVLSQLVAALRQSGDSVMLRASALAVSRAGPRLRVIASTGQYEGLEGQEVDSLTDPKASTAVQEALQRQETVFHDNEYAGYFRTSRGSENVIYLCGDHEFGEMDRNLIRLFAANIAVAFDNLDLNNEIAETQRELMFILGDVVETRSKETANHVRRVAAYTAELAGMFGVDEEQADLMRQASPMHDLGKIGIPDAILLKPAKLTPDEFEVIKTHTSIGHQILSGSDRSLTKMAAEIALNHHERWDGRGYPQGLAGEDIPLSGRITALADVFDALICKRVYKDPWPVEQVEAYFRQERGKHFDPQLTDLLLKNLHVFIDIQQRMPD